MSELSQANLKKLKKHEVSEIIVCLRSKNAKINKLRSTPSGSNKGSDGNCSKKSKKIQKSKKDNRSQPSKNTNQTHRSERSQKSKTISNSMKETGIVPKNSSFSRDGEGLLFLSIKGINLMREIYLSFGVDFDTIDETIKIEPQLSLIKMLLMHKPFLTYRDCNIDSFFQNPGQNLNLTSFFGIYYQIEQITALNGSEEYFDILGKIEQCVNNLKIFLKDCLSLLKYPLPKELMDTQEALVDCLDDLETKIKKQKERKNINLILVNNCFTNLLKSWTVSFTKILNLNLASLLPNWRDFEMRGDLKIFFDSLEKTTSFSSFYKEINWEIVEFYDDLLQKPKIKNQVSKENDPKPKVEEFLKLLNVLLSDIEFHFKIENLDEEVSIKFPVYDKKHDLFTSKEASGKSKS